MALRALSARRAVLLQAAFRRDDHLEDDMTKHNGTRSKFAMAAAAIIGLVLATPAAAIAQPTSTSPGFGHHVSECAQTMGFSGDHNPVMHRGAFGWDGIPC